MKIIISTEARVTLLLKQFISGNRCPTRFSLQWQSKNQQYEACFCSLSFCFCQLKDISLAYLLIIINCSLQEVKQIE